MDSYRVSKAWHLGHEVAESIHYLVKIMRRDDENLPGYLRAHSVMIPHLITLSTKKKSKVEKIKCYEQSRQAAIDLVEYLDKARSQKLIEEDYYKKTAAKLIEIQKQLTTIIRKAKQDLAAVEKEKPHGFKHHRT